MRRDNVRETIKQISLEGGTELLPIMDMTELIEGKLKEMKPQSKNIQLCNKSVGKILNEFENVERHVVRSISYYKIMKSNY